METSLIVSIVIAVVAIVPGVWALVNQANKDKNQAKMDMNKAAQDAAMNIIGPLQTEVTRLQLRVLELEKALVDKTTEIGNLMQAGIDKDSKIRTLEYNLSDMKIRLNEFESKRKSNGASDTIKNKRKEEDANLIIEREKEDLKADEEKKLKIQEHTDKTIQQITNGSLVNIPNTEKEI
jgi:hypothetical protein